MQVLKTIRIVAWTLVAVAAMGAIFIYFGGRDAGRATQVAAASEEQYGAGDYRLVTHDGREVDDSVFVGKPTLVFFGFTHCPDVCPTTLADMGYWFSEMGEDADRFQSFFVTVDPERDTPQIMGEYLSLFSGDITGLTGEAAEIQKAVEAWGVYAARADLDGGGYNMDHTASVFLLDAEGRFFGTVAYEESAETAVGKLRRMI